MARARFRPGQRIKVNAAGIAVGWASYINTHQFFVHKITDGIHMLVRMMGPVYNNQIHSQQQAWFDPYYPDTPFYKDLYDYLEAELS